MKDVLIVGTGRLAKALVLRLASREDIHLRITGRQQTKLESWSKELGVDTFPLEAAAQHPAHIVLLAVKDSAVEPIAAASSFWSRAVVFHLSGTLPLASVANFFPHAGVVYPLQTFALPHEVNWAEIAVLSQYTSPVAQEVGKWIVSALGCTEYPTDDEQRRRMHLCAVWANNFTRLMLAEAQRLCEKWNLRFDLLKPLITTTTSPGHLQHSQRDLLTGPAARGDKPTLEAHLQMLKDDPESYELYKLISNRIKNILKAESRNGEGS
ncbi:MAG: F420-dependent NADP oxidoreductase [Flavobacteriales bacterium]|nr:F420-dependent NADP oxidoreductase [Flavobacteriales bacterium]MDW8409738.1 F420-dependent NADP oxidoreductase [Flavobacteriales bacterium]